MEHSETLSLLEVPNPFEDDDDENTENDNSEVAPDEAVAQNGDRAINPTTAATVPAPLPLPNFDSIEKKFHSPEFQKKCTLLKLQGTNMKYNNSCGLMVNLLLTS